MRYGAISKINSVILEFVRKNGKSKIRTKDKIKRKKLRNNEFLVKVEFNLEYGNIRCKKLKIRKSIKNSKGIKDGKFRIRKNI